MFIKFTNQVHYDWKSAWKRPKQSIFGSMLPTLKQMIAHRPPKMIYLSILGTYWNEYGNLNSSNIFSQGGQKVKSQACWRYNNVLHHMITWEWNHDILCNTYAMCIDAINSVWHCTIILYDVCLCSLFHYWWWLWQHKQCTTMLQELTWLFLKDWHLRSHLIMYKIRHNRYWSSHSLEPIPHSSDYLSERPLILLNYSSHWYKLILPLYHQGLE